MRLRLAGLIVLTVGSVLASTPAHAFVCTVIPGGGPSVFWEGRSIGFTIHEACSADVDNSVCLEAVRASYRTWTDVDCSDFQFVDMGTTENARAGYDWRRPDSNHNVLVFREGKDGPVDTWPHAAGALAITTLTFNSRTGRVLDADIEMNGVPNGSREFHFAVCPDQGGCTQIDIQNTVTHEVGHIVGLDHPVAGTPGASETTMFNSAPPGEIKKRSLSQDDMDGVCSIYPAAAATHPCVPAPVDNGEVAKFKQVAQCDDTAEDPCGTGCPRSPPALPTLGGMLFLSVLKRRQQSRPGR